MKITSPTKGQHVPLGNIIISGISSFNITNHCTVSVIIDGAKPYQQATPTGSKTPNDYSNWTFTTSNNSIKEGANKITAILEGEVENTVGDSSIHRIKIVQR